MSTRTHAFHRRVALLAAFCALCVAIFVLFYRAGGGDLPGGDRYRVEAVVPSAVALSPAAQVRMAGVPVGTVAEIGNRGGNAVLALELDREHAPVNRDARVRVRIKSLVGENYVELDPGSPRAGALPDGGVLPIANADEATQLDEILSVLDRHGRRALRATLDGLGGGLRGPALNRLFAASTRLAADARPVAALLAGQRRQVAGLVDDLGRVMRALGDRASAIRSLAAGATTTARAVAARDAALASTLDQLPSTLRQADATADHLAAFAPRATPVLADLRSGLDALAPAIDRLRPAAGATRIALQRLDAFAAGGTPLLRDLTRFARRARPAVPALDRMLAELNPLLAYAAPRSREIGAYFSTLRSFSAGRDATGQLGRVHGIVSSGSLAAVTPQQEAVLDALLESGVIGKLRKRENNAYPGPGTLGAPVPFSGRYPRIEALPPLVR